MKVFYMGVFRNETRPALELCAEKELSSFPRFQRGSIGELLTFFSRLAAEDVKGGKRASGPNPDQPNYHFHAYGRDGVAGVMVTDDDYSQLVAHEGLSKIVDEFLAKYPYAAFSDPSLRENACPLPQLKKYIVDFQDPSQFDRLVKIDQELKETKQVLGKAIEQLGFRQEELQRLEDQTGEVSAAASMFYKQAKKQNSCCVVM